MRIIPFWLSLVVTWVHVSIRVLVRQQVHLLVVLQLQVRLSLALVLNRGQQLQKPKLVLFLLRQLVVLTSIIVGNLHLVLINEV